MTRNRRLRSLRPHLTSPREAEERNGGSIPNIPQNSTTEPDEAGDPVADEIIVANATPPDSEADEIVVTPSKTIAIVQRSNFRTGATDEIVVAPSKTIALIRRSRFCSHHTDGITGAPSKPVRAAQSSVAPNQPAEEIVATASETIRNARRSTSPSQPRDEIVVATPETIGVDRLSEVSKPVANEIIVASPDTTRIARRSNPPRRPTKRQRPLSPPPGDNDAMSGPRRNPKRKVQEHSEPVALRDNALEEALAPMSEQEIAEWEGWVELESEPVRIEYQFAIQARMLITMLHRHSLTSFYRNLALKMSKSKRYSPWIRYPCALSRA